MQIICLCTHAQSENQIEDWISKGDSLAEIGKYQDAISIYKLVCGYYKESKNIVNDNYAYILNNTAKCYSITGNFDKAIEYGILAMNIIKDYHGEFHPFFVYITDNVAGYYSNNNEIDKAVNIELMAVESAKIVFGNKSQEYITVLKHLAEYYNEKGDYSNAINTELDVLDIIKQTENIDSLEYFTTLTDLIKYNAAKGDNKSAIKYQLIAVDLVKLATGENSKEYAQSLEILADMYLSLNDFNNSLKYETKSMSIYKFMNNGLSSEYIESLIKVSKLYSKLDDKSKAMEYIIIAENISKQLYGKDSKEYAQILYIRSSYYADNKDYDKAIEYGLISLEIKRNFKKEYVDEYIKSLNNLIYYYNERENYITALNLGIEAISLHKDLHKEDDEIYFYSLTNLSNVYLNIGDYDNALKLEKMALAISTKIYGEAHYNHINCIHNLSCIYSEIGDFSKAVGLNLKALGLYEKYNIKDDNLYAFILNGLSVGYANLGYNIKAIEYAQKSVHIRSDKSLDYSMPLINLAGLYLDVGDYNKALTYVNKASDLTNKISDKTIQHARTLNKIASCYDSMEDYKNAINHQLNAVELTRVVCGENDMNYAKSLCDLSIFEYHNGLLSDAIEHQLKGYDILKKNIVPKSHPYYLSALENLAVYYYAIDDLKTSKYYCQNYISLVHKYVLNQFSNLNTRLRFSFWPRYSSIFNQLYPSIFYKANEFNASDLYNNSALFAKGLLLASELEINKTIKDSGNDEIQELYDDIKSQRNQLQILYKNSTAQNKVILDSLERNIHSLDNKLTSLLALYGDFKKSLNLTWQEIQNCLKDDEIAIEFLSFPVFGSDSIMIAALTLRKEDIAPKFMPLFEKKQLPENVVNGAFDAQGLAKLIWEPLNNELKDINVIYFSPAGVLNNIGFEYASGMEKYKIFRLSSTRELINLKRQEKTNESYASLLYGGIDYDTIEQIDLNDVIENDSFNYEISNIRSILESQYNAKVSIKYLPETLLEVKEIQSLLETSNIPVTIITGAKATKSSLRNYTDHNPSILHIATHGFYFPPNHKKTNVYKHSQHKEISDNIEDWIMQNSGLFFAGVNKMFEVDNILMNHDNGILTSEEISKLDLHNVEMVILSACNTGRNQILDNELFGLQRAFKKAGAKSILMSLWEVDDLATRLIMTDFYRSYTSGVSKRESLIKAQQYVREYKDEEGNLLFEDPYYWAGFVLLDAIK